jgi:AcrR family transcriptional regulator
VARPRSDEARRKALEAARQLIVDKGVVNLTIDDVAARSGVAKTTIYRHWPERTALIVDTVNAMFEHLRTPDTGSLRGDLGEIHRRYLEVARPQQAREWFVWMVAKAIEDPTYREMFRRARFQSRGPTVVALQRAIARGEIDADIDVEAALHIIQGPLISQRIVDNSPVTDRELESLLDMITRALDVAT